MAAQEQAPTTTEHSDDGGHGEGDDGASLTATLPVREGWWSPFYLFRGRCWLTRPAVESNTAMHAEFQPRPDDIILATYPKCGTTWLKALAFAIANRSKHPVAGADDGHHGRHPLLTRSPHDLVPFFDLRPATDLAAIPSPRILGTHLPLQLLPSGTAALGCRIVCVCREPKDAFVSTWYYMNKIHGEFHIELDKALELFCEGVSIYGPIWENFLSYWKQSRATTTTTAADKRQVLFLRYEEMMADPVRHAKMLAEFIGVPFTDEEESGGVVEEVVRLCSFDNLRALPVNSVGTTNPSGRLSLANSAFFRSAKVGDWVNYLTEEMAQKLDRVTEEKLRGSGLSF